MAQATRMVSAIQMKHLCNLAAVAEQLTDKNPSAVVGYVVGKATGIGFRAAFDADSGPSIGLVGAFRGVPTDPSLPVLTGPAFFPPRQFAEMAKNILLDGVPASDIPKKAPAKGKGVNVAGKAEMELKLEISIERNTGGGVPYKFAVVAHGEGAANDPFDGMMDFIPKETRERALIPASETKRIAAPKKKRAK